ncbi:MAG: 50S ribosomal protein L11 methyltransferase [Pseudomonadota bacterium]|nr:50S ribosomal protein L11 methyltransferase [Pseudomonadota bacterium]
MTTDPLWEIVFQVSCVEHLEVFEGAFEGIAVGISTFKLRGTLAWRVAVLAENEPDSRQISLNIAIAAAAAGVESPEVDFHPVIAKDWVAEVEKLLSPIQVGPYFICGSHIHDRSPVGSVKIRIDAGLAFGTGDHETTQGCLRAIEEFCTIQSRGNALDLGTGSGILAIALAKRFSFEVAACDNDPVAIDVARKNALLNGVAGNINFYIADGLAHPKLSAWKPYDIVIANLVSNPLIVMAKDISGALTTNGTVILSGILIEQTEGVIAAYTEVGFVPARRITLGDWETLVFRPVI